MPHAFSRRLGRAGSSAGAPGARCCTPAACRPTGALTRRAPSTRPPGTIGALPLHSCRHGALLHNEVPGITIPDPVRACRRGAGDRALRVGLDLAHARVHEVRRRHAGTSLMPSFGRFDVVAEVLDAVH